ncbi:hypothetical protein Tco_1416785 [Tanacetum coccineum]
MMLDRFTQHTMDPLNLMSNVSHQQYYSQSSTTPPSTYVPPHFANNTQLDSGLSPSDNLIENLTNTLALLTQSYKKYLPQTNNQLRTSSNLRNQATVQDGRVIVQNVQGRQNRGHGNNARGAGAAGYGGAQNRVGNANPEHRILQRQDVSNASSRDVDEQPVQDLALNVDNVFQADDCDAFDSDVDEAPTAQTMFMANLSSAYPVYDEAGPSYDSYILSEVHDHDHYKDAVCEHHEEHEMHDDVQPNYVVDSHANYTSDSNMIPYDQYVKDSAVPVVQSNVSSVPNDAYMMIFNDMHEPHAQSVSDTTRNTVVDNSLTAELATYKEQVELYERRARFDLTEREQKIDDQLRIVITDRNIKEENLKKELHSVKMQLASTINHNKSMVEEVTALDFWITQLTKKVTVLQEQNKLFRAENKKIKQHYKELYDSIKIKRAKHIEQTTALTTENENLKAQIQNKMKSVTKDHVKPIVLAPGKYAIDVEPIPPHNRNNREVHLDYLRHLKESVETLREIVEEAKVERPLDRSIVSASRYTKHSHELLEYGIGTCSKDFNQRDKKHAPTPLIRKKQVTFEEQCDTSNGNTHKHVEQLNTQKTNVPVPSSTGVNCCTNASGSQPRSNIKKNRISPAKGVNKKKVEEHPRTNKFNLRTTNCVDSSSSSKRTIINSNSDSVCQTCNKCVISANHDVCVCG